MHTNKTIDTMDKDYLRAGKGRIYAEVISSVEVRLIENALADSYGNQVMAARILGVNRNTLRVKIKKFNIDVKRFK